MNDDELKKLWREQPLALPAELTGTASLADMSKKMKRFDRIIRWRDFREVVAGLVVIVVFGYYFFRFPSPLARLGCVLTILAAAFTDVWSLWNKRQAGRQIPGASVMDSLRVELRKVQTQIRLLRSVLWWYILPIMGGTTVFYFGINRNGPERTVTLVTFTLLGWFIDWLNQLAVRRYLLPLKNELESLMGIPPEIRAKARPARIKKYFFLALLIGGGALFLGYVAFSVYAEKRHRTDAEIIALLDKCVVEQKCAPGMVIGILDDKGARVFAKGVREKDQTTQVNGDTVFEIGGVTTVFTGLLLEEMAESGELSLDDPIGKYLPPTVKTPARKGKEITLVDLATQTSGLPRMPDNFHPADEANPYADYTVEQLYDFLSHYQLKRDIGAKHVYSNLGAGLLGHILALKAGTNFETLVARRICDPLQMNSTRITLTPELKARLAPGHSASGETVKNWDEPTLAGSGGLRSTANDLLKFLAANIGLTNSSLSKAMNATHQPRHGTDFFRNIGLFWRIDTMTIHDTVWHDGVTGGYACYVGFKINPRRAVVVLANSENGVADIGQYLLGDLSGIEDFEAPKSRQMAQIDPRIYDSYVGQYKFPLANVTITVTREGGHLFARMTGQEKLEFFPETKTDFFCKDVDAQLTFEKDATGAVKDVILHQNGLDQTVKRIKN